MDLVLLVLRVAITLVLGAHGSEKVFGSSAGQG
jgi:hypothetical protein